jgi:hypothetical protein
MWIRGRPGVTSKFIKVKQRRGAVDLEDFAKWLYRAEQDEAVAAEEAKRTSPRGRRAQSNTRAKATLLALKVALAMAAGETKKGAVADLVGPGTSRSTIYAAIRANLHFFYGRKLRKRRRGW